MRITLSDRQAVFLLVVMCGTPVLASVMSWVATGSKGAAVGTVTFALVSIAGAVAFTVWRKRNALDVAIDDGGLRIKGPDRGEYISFATIRSAWTRSTLGRVMLHVETNGGAKSSFSMGEAQPHDVRAIESTCVDRAGQPARPGPPILATLAKGSQPLDAWLRRVGETTSGDSYRQHAADLEELTLYAEDTAGDVEHRAAAAHVVVRSGDQERAARVMSVLGPKTPPLMIVAAALATIRGTYVAELDEALQYLSRDDRAIARRMLEERRAP